MILEWIGLKNVGPFRRPVRVGLFSQGINVLAAPNESGKSTFARAALRAFFDRHTCKDSKLKTLQPSGFELAPSIAVGFRCGTDRYKIEKTFLIGPRCVLARWDNGRWETVAEGDQADQKTLNLLKGQGAARGASQPVNWGLLTYLWARQGEPVNWPSWQGAAGAEMQSRLAQVELDETLTRAQALLRGWSDALITGTGQARSGGDLKEAEARLGEAETELSRVLEKEDQIRRELQEYQSLTLTLPGLEKELEARRKQVKELRETARRAEKVFHDLQEKRRDLERRQEALMRINKLLARMDELRSELRKAEEQSATADRAAREIKKRDEAGRAEIIDCEERLKLAEKEEAEAKALAARAGAGVRRAEWVSRLERLKSALNEAEGLQGQRHEAAMGLSALAKVSPGLLKRVTEADEQARKLRYQIEALGVTVTLLPEIRSEIIAKTPDEERRLDIEAGASEVVRAAERLNLVLQGWGTIEIKSGARELASLAEELRLAERSLRSLLEEAGAKSLDDCRDAFHARTELESRIEALDARVKTCLGSARSMEDAQVEARSMQSAIARIEEQFNLEAVELATDIKEWEKVEAECLTRLSARESALSSARTQLDKLRAEHAGLLTEKAKAVEEFSTLKERKETLRRELDALERDEVNLPEQKAAAQREFVNAEARVNTLLTELPPDHDKLWERVNHCDQSVEETRSDLEGQRKKLNEKEVTLNFLGGEALHSRKIELAERCEALRQKRDRLRTRALAARIGCELIEWQKSSAARTALAPLEKRLSAVFGDLTGVLDRQIFLTPELNVRGVGRTVDESIEFDDLSAGAKEQLLLALRLAVAGELSQDEPQALLLDDALVNTDAARQGRILEVLQSLSADVQIVVLTCHPDRYRGMGQILKIEEGEWE